MTELDCDFICSKLADFLSVTSNKLIEVVQIYEKPIETALDTTQLGRDLFLGYLRYMMKKHRAGKAWGGDFCVDDLQVTDGCIFEITKDTIVDATRRAMEADMKQLAKLLVQYYETSSGSLPCYFTQLQSDMDNCFESLGQYNSGKTKKFHKCLESHLALKSAVARGHLFLDLYRVSLLISKVEFQNLQTFIRSPEIVLVWTSQAKKHPVLRKTLGEGLDKEDTRPDSTTQSTPTKGKVYENNLDHLLVFLRHVAQHGADHSKV